MELSFSPADSNQILIFRHRRETETHQPDRPALLELLRDSSYQASQLRTQHSAGPGWSGVLHVGLRVWICSFFSRASLIGVPICYSQSPASAIARHWTLQMIYQKEKILLNGNQIFIQFIILSTREIELKSLSPFCRSLFILLVKKPICPITLDWVVWKRYSIFPNLKITVYTTNSNDTLFSVNGKRLENNRKVLSPLL